MFECPECHTPVPKSKSFFLNKSSVIQCQNCKANLKPKGDTIKKIGGIGAGATAASAYAALKVMGLLGAIVVLVIGIIIVAAITVNSVEFELADL